MAVHSHTKPAINLQRITTKAHHLPPHPVAYKGKNECDRALLSQTAKTQRTYPAQRVIRDNRLGFDIKKPRILTGSHERARYPDYQGLEWQGVNIFVRVKDNGKKSSSFPKNGQFDIVAGSVISFSLFFSLFSFLFSFLLTKSSFVKIASTRFHESYNSSFLRHFSLGNIYRERD